MDYFVKLIALIVAIPSAIWAAIIAAGIAGTTSVLNNRNARRIVEIQLRNANDQSEAKRTMDLKRDVFLPAVRAAAEANALAGRVLDVNTPDENIQAELQKFGADMAGVHVAASDKTLQAVVELSACIGRLFMKLNTHRGKLKVAKAEIDIRQKIFDRRTELGEVLLERMRDQNLSGYTKEERDRINASWDVHREHTDKILEDLNNATRVFNELNAQSLELMATNLEEVMKAQSNALFALRRDLGLPIKEDEYLDLMSRSMRSAKEGLDETRAFVRSFSQQSA